MHFVPVIPPEDLQLMVDVFTCYRPHAVYFRSA